MNTRFRCMSCRRIFDRPTHYAEYSKSGELVDEWDGCPYCAGDWYLIAYQCSCCGEYFDGGYETKDGEYYCDDCIKVVGENDE